MNSSVRNTGIRQASHLTGRTLGFTKKLFDTICDVGHPYEMIFVEPTNVFLGKIIGDCNDRLAFELQSLPGVSKVSISVVTLFPLQVKFVQSFSGMSLGKMSAGLMDAFRRQNIPKSFLSLAAVSTFTP